MLAQRSRLCFAGGLRDMALVRDGWGLVVIGILFAGVLIYNVASGSFNLSFVDQPIAHTEALWNILGMYIVGFGATLLGGCLCDSWSWLGLVQAIRQLRLLAFW